MRREHEFVSETFHMLAQPITALRATVELGLGKELDGQAAHQVLNNCLGLIDRLMQDLAVFREISNLEDAPPLDSREAHTLVQSCVEEMTIVAEATEVRLALAAESAMIRCNEQSFRRALFVLLDEMIAAAPPGAEISIALRSCEDGAILQVRPGMPSGQRKKLCLKLLEFAGGSDIRLENGQSSVCFRENSYRQYQAITSVDKQVLTFH